MQWIVSERNLVKERVKAGLANAKAKGAKLGRPSPKFNEDELIRLRRMGFSTRAIATKMNLKKTFVHKAVKNLMPVRKTSQNLAPVTP